MSDAFRSPPLRLIARLEELRHQALELERQYRAAVAACHPEHRASARNLLHYLAVRQQDLRPTQNALAGLGLSRLARAEAHVLASLDAVLTALSALAGEQRVRATVPAGLGMRAGPRRLEANAARLLGAARAHRPARVMVTLPAEAATNPRLVHELILAGMDVARVNCAHDDVEAWRAMVHHVRQAERATGRSCRVYADLAGPKLRTGPLRPVGRLLELKARRDPWGRVTEPARVWLTPRGCPEACPEPVDAVLPLEDALVAAIHAGDTLDVDDTRGSRRHLTVKERFGQSWLAHGFQHAYLAEGAGCELFRDEHRVARGRIGPLPEVVPPLVLRPGDLLRLIPADRQGGAAELDAAGRVAVPASIPCTLDAVFQAACPGQAIRFDDGRIGGRVVAVAAEEITVAITQAAPGGSKLRPEKGINLPDTELDIPALTDADLAHLASLAPLVDMVGLSFTRRAEDVEALRERLLELDAGHLGMVLKIETRQAFENLPRILLAAQGWPSAGIMVARGDLAVEIGFERLAEVQEEILWLCEAAHMPVIWATQVLESMARRGQPSRAEVSDAVMSGRAECVMLNKGPYIVETVAFLDGVLERMAAHRAKSRPMFRRLEVSRLGEG